MAINDSIYVLNFNDAKMGTNTVKGDSMVTNDIKWLKTLISSTIHSNIKLIKRVTVIFLQPNSQPNSHSKQSNYIIGNTINPIEYYPYQSVICKSKEATSF